MCFREGVAPNPPAGTAPASSVPKKKCRLEYPSFAMSQNSGSYVIAPRLARIGEDMRAFLLFAAAIPALAAAYNPTEENFPNPERGFFRDACEALRTRPEYSVRFANA